MFEWMGRKVELGWIQRERREEEARRRAGEPLENEVTFSRAGHFFQSGAMQDSTPLIG